jgi:hypothetical protein
LLGSRQLLGKAAAYKDLDERHTFALNQHQEELERATKYCTVHNDSTHGAEAEQLRSRLEKLIHENQDFEDESLGASEIRRILDDVDACDSLAFLEQAKAKDEEIDRLRARVKESLRLARNGWQSARVLAIAPPTFGAPATEWAADEALARIEELEKP